MECGYNNVEITYKFVTERPNHRINTIDKKKI